MVSLDIAGTLVNLSYFDHFWNAVIPQLYAQAQGIAFDEAKKFVLNEYERIGSHDIRWYLPAYWFSRLNLLEDPMTIFKSSSKTIQFFPDVSPGLQKLNRCYQLITASGIPRNMQKIVLSQYHHHFNHFFSAISDLQQITKTTKFYTMICEIMNIAPNDILHIGDDWLYDFTIPRKLGIKCIILDRTRKEKTKFVINDLSKVDQWIKNI